MYREEYPVRVDYRSMRFSTRTLWSGYGLLEYNNVLLDRVGGRDDASTKPLEPARLA